MTTKIYAHIQASRPYTVIWCGLVSLAGACISLQAFPPFQKALLITFIPMMGWIAGLYLNDYVDRNLDAIQKPHRPIPSGLIHKYEALAIGGIFAIAGFILSFYLGLYNILLVFPVALLVFCYAKCSKSKGIFGNINRGAIIVAAFFFGVFSINTTLETIPLHIWLLSIVFFIHDTNSNLIGTIRDQWGDKKGGYNTIPVKYGITKTLYLCLTLSIFYIILTVLLTTFYNFIHYPIRFYTLFGLSILILCSMYISLFKKKITRQTALKAHEFFVAERITYASAFIAAMTTSLLVSSSIFMLCLIISLVTQTMLRQRYEFMEEL